MQPQFSIGFNLNTNKIRLTDTLSYSNLIFDAGYGNLRASIGSLVFENNTQFDSNADIVIGSNTFKDFDLPLSGGEVLTGSYSMKYSVLLQNLVLLNSQVNSGYLNCNAPGSSTFSQITLVPSISIDLLATLNGLRASLTDVRIGFYDNSDNLLGSSQLVSATTGAFAFESITLAGFAGITKVRVLGSNIYETSKGYFFNGCPKINIGLNVTADCYRSILTARDTSTYELVPTSLVRTLTIQYPRLSTGNTVQPTVISNLSSQTIGPNIWTGAYTISLSLEVSYIQSDGLVVQKTLTSYQELVVSCDANLCKALGCIDSFRVKYLEAVKTGSRDLLQLRENLLVINTYVMEFNIAVQCQKTELADRLLSELIDYMGDSDCHCGCNDTKQGGNEPTEIFPVYSVIP